MSNVKSQNLSFSKGNVYQDIRRESSPAKALKWGTQVSIAKIWPIIGHNLETVQDRKIISILTTDWKSHMGFQWAPKSVTLNDLARPNDRVVCVI